MSYERSKRRLFGIEVDVRPRRPVRADLHQREVEGAELDPTAQRHLDDLRLVQKVLVEEALDIDRAHVAGVSFGAAAGSSLVSSLWWHLAYSCQPE